MFKKYFFGLSLKIGLTGALAIILYFFVFYFMDNEASDPIFLFDLWIPPFFIFITIKFFRDKLNNGELRFWEGLALGTQVSLWICFISCSVLYIFYQWMDSAFFNEYIEQTLAVHQKNKAFFLKEHNGKIDLFNRIGEGIKNATAKGFLFMKFLRNFSVSLFSVVLFSVLFRR